MTDMAPSMSCLLANTTKIAPFNSSSWNFEKYFVDKTENVSVSGKREFQDQIMILQKIETIHLFMMTENLEN